MNVKELLQYYGLDNVQIKVYEKLVESNEMRVPHLVEELNISRASIYDAIKELQEKNLIISRKEGRKTFYKAEHPDKLSELIEDKQRELETKNNRMKEVIDKLKGEYMKNSNRPGVRVFEGKDGFKEAMYDNLKAEGEIYAILDMRDVPEFVYEMDKEYVKKRKEKGIQKKILTQGNEKDLNFIKNEGSNFTQVRILPTDFNPFDSSIQIYNNKISYFTLRENQILAVIVNDPDIAEINKNLFQFLWQQQKGAELFPENKDEEELSLREKMQMDVS